MPFSYCKFYLLSFLSLCPVECGWFKLFVTFKCLQSHHIVIACRVEAPITTLRYCAPDLEKYKAVQVFLV